MADDQHKFRDSYLAADLTFEDDKITWHCPETNDTREVMMEWEQPIMTKMAEVAVDAGDHVLECGFGMGILSNAVQARNPASHTIVECHPQVITKLKEWAVGKSNVTIVEGKWMDLLSDNFTRYDTILMDTYVDDDLHGKFRYFCKQKAKDGAKISWWNFSGGTHDDWMKFYWKGVTFTEVACDPPENTYYNRKVYHIPLKILNKTHGWGVLDTSNINTSESGIMSVKKAAKNMWMLSPLTGNRTDIACTQQQMNGAMRMKCQGITTLNDNLISASDATTLWVKRDGSWITDKIKNIVVGDILKGIKNEIEVTKVEFDGSDTVYDIVKIDSWHPFFINGILIKDNSYD